MDAKEILLQRITLNPKVMVGKPVIRGTRLPVDLIVALLAEGASFDEILKDYPHVEREDIRACLMYASETLRGTTVYPLAVETA